MYKILIIFMMLLLFSCNSDKTERKTEAKKLNIQKVEVKKDIEAKKDIVKKNEKVKVADKVVKVKRAEKVFMWKVKSETSTIYLLGSIHLAKSDIYPLDDRIENGYKASDNLVVEANVKKDMAKIQNESLKLAMYPKGKSLKDDLSKDVYDNFIKTAKEVGVNEVMLSRFKPFMATLVLLTTELGKLGYSSFLGIDIHFINQADKDKKPILELENGIDQLRMLAGFSKEVNEENVKLFNKNWKNLKSDFEIMFNAWKNGDYKKIEEISYKDMNNKKLKPFYDKLFFERNANMTKKIVEYLKTDKTYFIIVGSAHYVGEKGIIQLLKKDGYKPEQL